jgi:hypothetical protein
MQLWGRAYLRIQTASEANVQYINWLRDDPTCGKPACIPREKQAPSDPSRTGKGIGHNSPPHPPKKSHHFRSTKQQI